jgi:hypothetical protein
LPSSTNQELPKILPTSAGGRQTHALRLASPICLAKNILKQIKNEAVKLPVIIIDSLGEVLEFDS